MMRNAAGIGAVRALRTAAVAALMLPLPAAADPAQQAWDLFAKHCSAYQAARDFTKVIAAFKPYDIELMTTADGTFQSGNTLIEDGVFGDTRFASFNVYMQRVNRGTIKTCNLVLGLDGDGGFAGLPDIARERAKALLGGDDTGVSGGPIVTMEGSKGTALHFHTPGFPPERTVNIIATEGFTTLGFHTVLAD